MMIAPESSASGSSTDITAGHLNHPVGRLSAMFYKDLRLTALTLLLIAASGISSFFVLTRREDPMLTPRVAQVSTIFPGANAERVEALVTEKIERKLRDVPEIKQLMSNSRAGASFITIELMDEVRELEFGLECAVKLRTRLAFFPKERYGPSLMKSRCPLTLGSVD
jgi:multidrug efflux pump subunit AcrB